MHTAKNIIVDIHLSVYFFRLQRFEDYTSEMAELKRKLSGDELSTDEYKRALERFKVTIISH